VEIDFDLGKKYFRKILELNFSGIIFRVQYKIFVIYYLMCMEFGFDLEIRSILWEKRGLANKNLIKHSSMRLKSKPLHTVTTIVNRL
jgi:hypothetical protein